MTIFELKLFKLMKKIISVLCFSIFLSKICSAQQFSKAVTKESFTEWNFGVAFIESVAPFPGASFLWGKTHTYENNLIFEYEGGFAFPTLVTGKVGIGKKFENTKAVIGIRPFPFNIYGQMSIAEKENGYWIASIEYNPLNPKIRTSVAVINFGDRRNFELKKKKSIPPSL